MRKSLLLAFAFGLSASSASAQSVWSLQQCVGASAAMQFFEQSTLAGRLPTPPRDLLPMPVLNEHLIKKMQNFWGRIAEEDVALAERTRDNIIKASADTIRLKQMSAKELLGAHYAALLSCQDEFLEK